MTPAVHAASFGPAILGGMLFLFAIVWSVRTAGSSDVASTPDWKSWLLIAGVLLCFRWPLIWLPYEIHPDESQMIAGAITLRHEPIFWRSVDGGTAGPFDFYPLLAAAFASPPHGYAVARIMAVVLIAGTLAAISESLACVAGCAVARLAVLPIVAFEAFTTSAEFVHYSTELAPGFLLALSIYAIARQTVRPAVGNIWLAAILLGAVPFAKLQATPLAGVLWLFVAGLEISAGRRANLSRLLIGALLPLAGAAVLVTVTGEAENLVIPYGLNNFAYVQGTRHSLGHLILYQWRGAVMNGYLASCLAGSAAYCIGALALRRSAPRNLRRFQLAAVALVASAVVCILVPGRTYDHYLNFLTVPLGCLLGSTLAIVLQPAAGATAFRQRILAGIFLACTLVPQLILRTVRPDPYAVDNFTEPRPAYFELARAVRALTTPGEALGIWGWRCSLYVETGLRQATRQAQNEAQLLPGKWQNYFLRRYLADFQASNPPVFVDTMGPGNFRFHDPKWGHEVFPELHDWVRTHYTFLTAVDYSRIYVRNDRLPAAQRAWPRAAQPENLSSPPSPATFLPPA